MMSVLACATLLVAWWQMQSLAREKYLVIEPFANVIPSQGEREEDL